MNICIILTSDWVDSHGVRFVRYAKTYNPDCKLYLFFLGDGDIHQQFPGFADNFENVVTLPHEGRDQYNRIRMSATRYFGVDSILYCDADADVLADLSGIPALVGDNTLACVDSPATHGDWVKMCKERDWEPWECNNGLLYITEDWGDRYDAAVKAVAEFNPNPRISGTISFNYMLRENEGYARLPYEYGVIWWDSASFVGAKVVQYCNDNGQAKREMMEAEYRASVVPKEDEDATRQS